MNGTQADLIRSYTHQVNVSEELAARRLKPSSDDPTWLESHPIAAPHPFAALSAVLTGSAGDDLQLRVRAVGNNDQPTAWCLLHYADIPSKDPNERPTDLVYFQPAARAIQYSIPAPINDAPQPNLRFEFIDPGSNPTERSSSVDVVNEHDGPESRGKDPAPISRIPKPPVVSRTDWGCPDGEGARAGAPTTTVTHLVVHHTADGPFDDYAAWVRFIWNHHTISNGWGDIGYNYLIAPDGTIYHGRAGRDNMLGAHFTCANNNTMGISILGNFTGERPTLKALQSVVAILAWKADQRGLDPLASRWHPDTQLNLITLCGHRDANPSTANVVVNCRWPYGHQTSCPGDVLYHLLHMIRQQVAARIAKNTVVAIGNDLIALDRSTGSIFQYQSRPFNWAKLDNNPKTVSITADLSNLYQLHSNGRIWRYTGPPMTGWELLDDNPATVALAADARRLYQLHNSGRIWRYTGRPRTGWELLDDNPATAAIVADGDRLYQLHNNGRIWRYTGTPMTGWELLDDNPFTCAIAASGGNLYQLVYPGHIWKYGGRPMSWQQLDDNPDTTAIVADGSRLYQLQYNGNIYRYSGRPMTGWEHLDNNPATIAIAASNGHLYQTHKNGRVWRYTGRPMTGWEHIR